MMNKPNSHRPFDLSVWAFFWSFVEREGEVSAGRNITQMIGRASNREDLAIDWTEQKATRNVNIEWIIVSTNKQMFSLDRSLRPNTRILLVLDTATHQCCCCRYWKCWSFSSSLDPENSPLTALTDNKWLFSILFISFSLQSVWTLADFSLLQQK